MRRRRAAVRHHTLPHATTSSDTTSRTLWVAGLVVLAAATAFLFWQSFEKWGDPVADLGRDLYVSTRLVAGDHLYRDLLYGYGPIAPYLLAVVIRMFGDGLAVFAACGLGIGFGTLGGVYALGAALGGRLSAFIASALFLVFSLFAHSTFGCNFVLPYSYAATFGAMCAVWSVWALIRSAQPNAHPLLRWFGVACLFLSVLAKIEIGAAVFVVHAVSWIVHRPGWRVVFATIGAGAIIIVTFVLLFQARSASEHDLWRDNLMRFAGEGAPTLFFSSVAGTLRWSDRLWEYAATCGEIAILAFVIRAAIRAHERALAQGRAWSGVSVAAIGIFAGGVYLWGDVLLFRALPIAALVAVVYYALVDRRHPLLLVSCLVLATAPRVLLNYTPEWYGFYLVVPAYALAPGLVLGALKHSARSRLWTGVALTAVTASVIAHCEHDMWRDYHAMTTAIVTPKGTMYDTTGRGDAIDAFCDYARDSIARGSTAVVFPEGVSLNYFTGLRNPTAYYNFIPPEIPTAQEEHRILAELQSHSPDYIVMLDRDVREFGSNGFCVDYGHAICSWIRSDYEVDKHFAPAAAEHSPLMLLRRRHATGH